MANQIIAVVKPSSGWGSKAWTTSYVSLCKTQSCSGLVLKINYGLDGACVLINKSNVVIHSNGLTYLIFRLNIKLKIPVTVYLLYSFKMHEKIYMY